MRMRTRAPITEHPPILNQQAQLGFSPSSRSRVQVSPGAKGGPLARIHDPDNLLAKPWNAWANRIQASGSSTIKRAKNSAGRPGSGCSRPIRPVA
jgi:hypothetical protein